MSTPTLWLMAGVGLGIAMSECIGWLAKRKFDREQQ